MDHLCAGKLGNIEEKDQKKQQIYDYYPFSAIKVRWMIFICHSLTKLVWRIPRYIINLNIVDSNLSLRLSSWLTLNQVTDLSFSLFLTFEAFLRCKALCLPTKGHLIREPEVLLESKHKVKKEDSWAFDSTNEVAVSKLYKWMVIMIFTTATKK